jgi:hypothetical protein
MTRYRDTPRAANLPCGPRRRHATAWFGALGAALLAVAPPGYTADPAPAPARAVDTFQALQSALADDKKRADWDAFLVDARRLQAFLNGSPTSGLEVARAQLQLGHHEEALAEVRGFLAMGQAHDILDASLFAPLKEATAAQLASNRTAISLAKPAFELSDAGWLPEDIDYDPRSKRFFVTSVLKHTIVVLDRTGQQRVFADSPDHWPLLAIKVDSKRRRLWATEVALDEWTAIPAPDWGRSVLLEFDLDRGTLLYRHEGPAHSNLGDMVLAPDGEPIVSDGMGGGIYRLRGKELVRIDRGDFISPQTIALCPDGRRAFVPDYVRGIAAFDIETGAVRWLPTMGRFALNGIDGLYCPGASLIAVQNGASPARVISFRLDASRSSVVAETVIERATPTLGDPTHGVFGDGAFFYIANSGWGGLDEHGVTSSSSPLSPAVIMRVNGLQR